MPHYYEERKAAVLSKLLPPANRTVASASAEEGISEGTLYNWLKRCRNRGRPVPGHRKTGDDWSPDAKLAVVIETAPMSETELSTYCPPIHVVGDATEFCGQSHPKWVKIVGQRWASLIGR